MKFYRKDLVILLTLLIVAGIACLFPQAQSKIEIQLHDTYYILDYRSLILWTLYMLLFFIFIVRAIATKFSSLTANIGLLLGLIILGWITYTIIFLLRASTTIPQPTF